MGEALVRLVPSMKASLVLARHHSSLRCAGDFVTRASAGHRLSWKESTRQAPAESNHQDFRLLDARSGNGLSNPRPQSEGDGGREKLGAFPQRGDIDSALLRYRRHKLERVATPYRGIWKVLPELIGPPLSARAFRFGGPSRPRAIPARGRRSRDGLDGGICRGSSRRKIDKEPLDNMVISAKLPLPTDGCAIDRDVSVHSNSI
jgi:hypothetical protein